MSEAARAERQEADRVGHLAGQLIEQFAGKATVEQMRLSYRAASQAVDLDRLLPVLRSAWESGDEASFDTLARDYLKASARLFDVLHELGGADGKFIGCDVEDKAGMHLAVSDSVLLKMAVKEDA